MGLTKLQVGKKNRKYLQLGFKSAAEYIASPEWKSLRAWVLARDGHKCRICNEKAVAVHHESLTEDVLRGENLSELIAVCKKCRVRLKSIDRPVDKPKPKREPPHRGRVGGNRKSKKQQRANRTRKKKRKPPKKLNKWWADVLKEIGFTAYRDTPDCYLRSRLWASIKQAALDEHGRFCKACRKSTKTLHHTDYSVSILQGNDLSVLVPVCERCHDLMHQGTTRTLSQANQKLKELIASKGPVNEQWKQPVPARRLKANKRHVPVISTLQMVK